MATLVSVYQCQMCNARGYMPYVNIFEDSWETVAERSIYRSKPLPIPHSCRDNLMGIGRPIGFIFRETSNTDTNEVMQWDVPAPVG